MAQDSNVFISAVDDKVLESVSTHNIVLALDRVKSAIERLTTALQSSGGVTPRPGNTPRQ